MNDYDLENNLDANLKLFRQLLCGALPDEDRTVLTQLIKCLDVQEHAGVEHGERAEALG
ncbi:MULTISPECIES: hypothetical protein [Rhodopseudomonas]|uniref:hypothetical protein n=1 Tax=Rhodopseudomonas TaxID=1073 RepID=UPI000AD84FCF|nr:MULTISPECIES: hypothetical protein [Rhodopseudomonas]MDF3811483.1 hypothetical protein [Rhodopseudomonas sp. BAL398]WOK16630.1 hypothetical protein RBJ75_21135 [Rhodopseudomonas sp. BAL398]